MIMCVKFIYSITWADHIHSFHKTTIKCPIILTCSFVLMYSEYMKRWLVIFLTFSYKAHVNTKWFDILTNLIVCVISLCWTRVNELVNIAAVHAHDIDSNDIESKYMLIKWKNKMYISVDYHIIYRYIFGIWIESFG